MMDIMVGVNDMQDKIDSLTTQLQMHSVKIHNIETTTGKLLFWIHFIN